MENKNIRVALCFSGQPRSFAEAYPYIKKNIIDCNPNVDVFIHCWYDEKEAGQKFKNTSDSAREGGINVVETNVPNQLIRLYQPKLYAFEPQQDFSTFIKPEYEFARDKTQPFATFSMWTSIFKCNELKKQYEKENDFIYDIVIKARFDLAITTPVYTSNLQNQNTIITIGPEPQTEIAADILFYTSSQSMDKVAELAHHLEEYFPVLGIWNNETFLYHHIVKNGLSVTHHPHTSFHLIRGKRSFIDTLWYYSKRIKQKYFTKK